MYPPLPLVVGPEACYVAIEEVKCPCLKGREIDNNTQNHDTITHVEEPAPLRQPQMPHPELVIVEK